MRQYRFTSEHFILPGETGEADAFMDAKELQELKKLAGMPMTESGMGDNGAGMVGDLGIQTPQAQEVGIKSPLGSLTNNTTKDRADLMREYTARTGTDLWFIINFGKPELTGLSLRAQVERYLKSHPEARQKQLPGSVQQ
jgi:hypothetical protein